MTMIYDQVDFDVRDYIEDSWETFLESSEDDWNLSGIVENLDQETLKMLEDFQKKCSFRDKCSTYSRALFPFLFFAILLVNEKYKLILAIQQVDNLISMSDGLDYDQCLKNNLYPVKYELQRQFSLLDKTYLSDQNQTTRTEFSWTAHSPRLKTRNSHDTASLWM